MTPTEMKSSNVTTLQSQTWCTSVYYLPFSIPHTRELLSPGPQPTLCPPTTASKDFLLGEPLRHSLTLLKTGVFNITSAFDGQGSVGLHFQADSEKSEPVLGISYHSRAVTERQLATLQAPYFFFFLPFFWRMRFSFMGIIINSSSLLCDGSHQSRL